MQWLWIKHLNASSQCSNHPTLSLVVRIKHLNAPSQCSRIFKPSTGSAWEGDIAIAMSWFSCVYIMQLSWDTVIITKNIACKSGRLLLAGCKMSIMVTVNLALRHYTITHTCPGWCLWCFVLRWSVLLLLKHRHNTPSLRKCQLY